MAEALNLLRLAAMRSEFFNPGVGLDSIATQLPRLLHDPRERPLLAFRLALHLVEHVGREVETLFFLVALHAASPHDRMHQLGRGAGLNDG